MMISHWHAYAFDGFFQWLQLYWVWQKNTFKSNTLLSGVFSSSFKLVLYIVNMLCILCLHRMRDWVETAPMQSSNRWQCWDSLWNESKQAGVSSAQNSGPHNQMRQTPTAFLGTLEPCSRKSDQNKPSLTTALPVAPARNGPSVTAGLWAGQWAGKWLKPQRRWTSPFSWKTRGRWSWPSCKRTRNCVNLRRKG